MRSILLTFILAVSGITAFSQTINSVPVKDLTADYIQITGWEQAQGHQFNIQIDYGQLQESGTYKDTYLKDEFGEYMTFNSMVAALNLMSKNGYEFVSAYTSVKGNENIFHYVLKKKKKTEN